MQMMDTKQYSQRIAELSEDDCVRKAIAAIEVRSSSFLCGKYKAAMTERISNAEARCLELRKEILAPPYGGLLESKNPSVHEMLMKATIKVNIDVGEPVIGKIDMPSHFSAMKELDRGRLLFYVRFEGGQGYLDFNAFRRIVLQ